MRYVHYRALKSRSPLSLDTRKISTTSSTEKLTRNSSEGISEKSKRKKKPISYSSNAIHDIEVMGLYTVAGQVSGISCRDLGST